LRNRVRLFPERREFSALVVPVGLRRRLAKSSTAFTVIAAFADICQRHICTGFFALKKLKKNAAALTFVIATVPQNF
jgi:hypothetical protein